ncbi:MAG: hypothetical protein HYZ79_09965, partial [Candidatus Melainabacteria bacterium]|nr:hypothetical protein [Candidatus Melainabacteria bacterium]
MSKNLKKLFAKEKKMGLFDVETYTKFYNKIIHLGKTVKQYIINEINNGETVIGLGASTKGNVLLQFFNINKKILPYISEINPKKIGLRTLGTDIELISDEQAKNINPICKLVLPWYFKKEIIKREKNYLKNWGRLLFPMPYPHVVTREGEFDI